MQKALRYTQKLEESGLTRHQAETQIEILSEYVEDEVVTKQDLTLAKEELRHEMSCLRSELKQDMSHLRAEVKQDISNLRSELKSDIAKLRSEMEQLEYRLTIKLGAISTVSMGALAAFLKLTS